MPQTIFATAPGSVVAISELGASPGSFLAKVPGFGAYENTACIITRLQFSMQTNTMVAQSVSDATFIYCTRDQPTPLQISGLAFSNACETGLEGLPKALSFFESAKVSATGLPVVVNVGASFSFRAFLLKKDADSVDSKSRIWQWQWSLLAIPKNKTRDDERRRAAAEEAEEAEIPPGLSPPDEIIAPVQPQSQYSSSGSFSPLTVSYDTGGEPVAASRAQNQLTGYDTTQGGTRYRQEPRQFNV